jgi:transcriptional regulator
MYRPKIFQEDDRDKLVTFMKANSFATLVSIVDDLPYASHIPMVVKIDGDTIKLVGHLAKQNPQWQAFPNSESLAIFTGAHSYISPTLYEQHESVPTWNYIAVHAYGLPKIITFNDTPELMSEMINDMVDNYEADYKSHWQSLSNKYQAGMMKDIIGFEITITRLEGKYKLSQNKSSTDRKNISTALLESPDPLVRAVGVEMKQQIKSD